MSEIRYDGPKPLLMEGKNDCFVIFALCQYHGIPKGSFGPHDCGSDNKAMRRLSALLGRPEEHDAIGIVLDADSDRQTRWEQLKGRLEKHKYILPAEPQEAGTILSHPDTPDMPRIGIWLMPDNLSEGMLEDFCQQLVDDTQAINFAKNCTEQARSKNFTTFKEPHFSKSVIHTYLAWQDEPGQPLGAALTAKYLNPEHSLAKDFVNFLKDLYQWDMVNLSIETTAPKKS